MLNDEIHAQYQAADEFDANSNSQANSSNLEGEGEEEYSEEEEVEFTKVKRDNIF